MPTTGNTSGLFSMGKPINSHVSPWVPETALALLRQKDMRLIAYMDEILLFVEPKEMLVNHLTETVYLLENLGFRRNPSLPKHSPWNS